MLYYFMLGYQAVENCDQDCWRMDDGEGKNGVLLSDLVWNIVEWFCSSLSYSITERQDITVD